MKKALFLNWLVLLTVFFVSCSDSDNSKGPDPEPPLGELSEGINLFPKQLDATAEAKIVFKASATSGLYGYTGDVYAHIGVVEGSDWRFVPAAWDENIDKCKMKKEEDNVWSISLTPDIRTWFGAPDDVAIQKIGVVFRSADGEKKGLTDDSFLTVQDDNRFIPGEVILETQPAGMIEGVNVVGSNTVTFILYEKDTHGKRKDFAYLIGDFNDWKLSHDYQMKRDEATGCWWYTLADLDPQKEYAFQYYIGDKGGDVIRLADAYTEKVIDPQDGSIPASTYPGLRSYPSDKTIGVISTFQIQPDEYNWARTDFKIKNKNNLVIYEMLFRDFTSNGANYGDVKSALAKLDYLQELGVNAIELMPIQEFDGNNSWGYNPCFYFAMDKAYGTKSDYKTFIDECHKRDIAVILDVVYNHATGAHPFAKLYWNAAKNETAANNPWFNVEATHPYNVFHDFNHESPLVRTFVKRNLKFLLEEYKIDGFRFDLSKGFTQTISSEGTVDNYDKSRVTILKDYNGLVKEVNPDAVVILEHFAVDQEELELAKDGMLLWRNLNEAYCQAGMGWSNNSSFKRLYTGVKIDGGWVGYMESHDEDRVAYKQFAYGNYDFQTNLSTRMKQLEVNAALFFTVPGTKMVWQFGELGYDVTIGNEEERTKPKPVKWEYATDVDRKAVYDTYSKLISLRTIEKPELFTSSTNLKWDVDSWGTGRYVSLRSTINDGLVAVGNFTDQDITCAVDFQLPGTWYDYMGEGTMEVVSPDEVQVAVPAHSFKVFVNFN